MAAQPGEERLLTVFADVHYYFSAPSPRPLSHRFDKGSYLYLHGNKSGGTARLEIANHVGKPEQDAFTGSLDISSIRQSHKHPTLCTVTVDGFKTVASSPRPEYHWKLPTADPRSERNLPLHLHTLDIYFWTAQDADSFISSAQRLLQPGQLELLDFPPTMAAHEQVMSPVVQKLENVAIKDPAYHNGQTRDSRTNSTVQSQHPGSNLVQDINRNMTPQAEDPNTFKPLAYNPAAPAAPEPIAHREKTPPPDDTEGGTGLAAAASADHMQAVSPQSSLTRPGLGLPKSSSGYVGGPAVSPFGGSYVGSPPSATGPSAPSITSSFAPPPTQSPHSAGSPSGQQVARLNSHTQQPPLDYPAAEILGDSYVGGHHQPLQHVQPQYPDYLASSQAEAPIGGYSDYKYTQQQAQAPTNEYDIHSQAYRPTEEEISKKKPSKSSAGSIGQQSSTGRVEDKANKVDKGVNRFFKKLEKRIG